MKTLRASSPSSPGMGFAKGHKLLGRWRIVAADQWDRDHLDLVAPAAITFAENGSGTLVFGACEAGLELEFSRDMVFFRLHGFDEGTELSGSGSADLDDDGTLEIEITFDHGDDATFRAHRA